MLHSKCSSSDLSTKQLNQLKPLLINAINWRETVFEPINTLAGRINSDIAAADVPSNLLSDVKTITVKCRTAGQHPKRYTTSRYRKHR